jgi:small conductance mechanosensitive channel
MSGTATGSYAGGLLREVNTRTGDVVDFLLGAPLRIASIVVGALVLRWLVHRAIARVVTRTVDSRLRERLAERRHARVLVEAAGALVSERRRQRAETIGSVLRSIASSLILGMAFVTVLGELGFELGPLLASAGVAGVALGFGAQSLVRDFLSGIFMILEDQYGVGDLVDTGSAVGTVEEVTLRVTRLRDGSGVVWYVRNGEILRVGNHSQGWSTGIVDVAVAYTEDVPRVQELIRATAEEMCEDEAWREKILEDPRVAGVESVTGASVTIRVIVKCAPNEHHAVQRELRERIKTAFDREGVQVPIPVFPSGPPPAPAG